VPRSLSVCRSAGAPNDASRAWAILIMTLGSTWATMVAGWVTPFVAGRWGWRAVPWVYSVTIVAVTLLWQATAHESPQAMFSQASAIAPVPVSPRRSCAPHPPTSHRLIRLQLASRVIS
jgi:MFS family permease